MIYFLTLKNTIFGATPEKTKKKYAGGLSRDPALGSVAVQAAPLEHLAERQLLLRGNVWLSERSWRLELTNC